MAATIYNAIIEQGADWEAGPFEVIDAASGEAVDFTGFVAKMQGRSPIDAASPLFTITQASSADGQITLGAGGLVTWRLRGARTLVLPAGKLYWDLTLVAPDTSILRPVKGEASVQAGATKL